MQTSSNTTTPFGAHASGVSGEPQMMLAHRPRQRVDEVPPTRELWTYVGHRERRNGDLGAKLTNQVGDAVGLPLNLRCAIGARVELAVLREDGRPPRIVGATRVVAPPDPSDSRLAEWEEQDCETVAAWERHNPFAPLLASAQ